MRLKSLLYIWAMAFLLFSCSPSLSKGTAEEVIKKHFEKRGYRVTALEIGAIGSIPLGEKQYMGAEGSIVSVHSITLIVGGESQSFNNARIRVKQQRGGRAEWIVANIVGIPLP